MVKKTKSSKQFQKLAHSPTLNTILMVEKTLQRAADRIITVVELKKMLPKQVNHNTLMNIIDYLDKSNKIAFNAKGMMWIHNPNPKFREAIRKAHDYDEILAKNHR
ncbi:hypothetical protein AYK26_06845 [Euryarchaeota archaeon SM23-78]|nr:MAG: hypothetical protein AYK26_06845 [Euryarchaeota archaeon SM23-78]MBW3000380.1 hypothetical protein [Candidatus Woesearchaeota archaeon]